jgi:hypothetical protein
VFRPIVDIRALYLEVRRLAGRRCQRAAETLLEAPCFSFELVGWPVGVVAHPTRAVHLLHSSLSCFIVTQCQLSHPLPTLALSS